MEHRSVLEIDYSKRLNKVFHHIDAHLNDDLSLTKLAEIAHFSPFHFHRLFKTITGETVLAFVTRKRIERAALAILHTDLELKEIAISHGFNDHPTFTRTFKKYYQVNPSQFKKDHPQRFSKIRQVYRKNDQVYPEHEKYICAMDQLKNWITMNATIDIKEMTTMNLAYVTAIGSAQLPEAFNTLIKWATPAGLMKDAPKLLTIYHDSFKVTEATKVRMSACIELHDTIQPIGAIGTTVFNPGKCIVSRYEIGPHEFEQAWTGLFLWMNENGYKKADKTPFEIYHNNFNEHPEQKAIVDFCIPIE